jgi:putative ABC transport system permease protein
MFGLKFIPLVVKQVIRHRTRTLLTVGGVAMAMFLFCAVQAMQGGVKDATETTARDTTLVAYRQNRFCPNTSRLPEYYGDRIAKIPGVVSVVPMKIVVTNCRTSLDVITFRGVPEARFVERYAPGLNVLDGSTSAWQSRTDAALVGEAWPSAAAGAWATGSTPSASRRTSRGSFGPISRRTRTSRTSTSTSSSAPAGTASSAW